jgi:hypothetical protein
LFFGKKEKTVEKRIKDFPIDVITYLARVQGQLTHFE